MQHPAPVPPTAPPPGYVYPWLPPSPVVPVYERLATHLVRHDTLASLNLFRCPTLVPHKAAPPPPPLPQHLWRSKHRLPRRVTGRCKAPHAST